ncbi:MAG: hypothetical protein NVSMB57_06470 [Actinomycetota bacterium]
MIAASAVLVVVAFITLIIGIFQDGLSLIWMSIASSVLAAIFLLLGVVKGRPPRVAAVPGGAGSGTWGEAETAPAILTETAETSSWEPAGEVIALEEPEIIPEIIEERPARSARTPSRSSTTRSTAARSARPSAREAAPAARPARTPAAQMPVVVIPDRDKFHKDTCRYAKTAGKMSMTKSEARREGYKACGVCKP